MKPYRLRPKYSLLLMLMFTADAYAVEPPLIVEQIPDEFVDKGKPKVDMPQQKQLSVTTQKGNIRVEHVQFQGGSVFELSLLAEKVRPIIGKQVGKTEIVKVLRAITKLYEDAGYVLSFAFVPKQGFNQGQLTIALVEGYVMRTEIEIADEDIKRRVERLVAKIQNEKPLTSATFERYVALIQKTPGYSFKVNVPKPKTINGATTIRVEELKSKKYDFTFGFDDSENEQFTLLAGASLQSMTSNADKLTMSTLIPNDTIDSYYALGYQQEIGAEGLTIDLAVNQFESHGDDRIFVTDIPVDYEEDKQRDRVSLGLKYPISLSKSSSWWIGTKLHYLDEKGQYGLKRTDGAGSPIEIDKHLRYSTIEINSQWQKRIRRHLTLLSVKTKQGIDLGNNKNETVQGNVTHSGTESTHFNLVEVNATWRYMLTKQWRLQTKGNLFWSDDILPSAEQVRYGGKRFGRGYPDGQAQGDRGYAGEMELRYIQPIPGHFLKRVEPYIVIDTAKSQLRANDNKYELSSLAVGADFSDAKHYKIGFEYAKPLGDANFETDDRSPIYNLRVRWSFN